MKILQLQGTNISNVTTQIWKNNKTGKEFHQIVHGSKLDGLITYVIRLSNSYFPVVNDEEIELKDKDYIIKPIKDKEGKIRKDKHNNNLYCLYKDNNSFHKDDIILFWSIPNKRYRDITYKLSGDVEEIAKASIGIQRDETLYFSPAPILEIYGNFSFTWEGYNINNEKVTQSGKYDYYNNNWVINPIQLSN